MTKKILKFLLLAAILEGFVSPLEAQVSDRYHKISSEAPGLGRSPPTRFRKKPINSLISDENVEEYLPRFISLKEISSTLKFKGEIERTARLDKKNKSHRTFDNKNLSNRTNENWNCADNFSGFQGSEKLDGHNYI